MGKPLYTSFANGVAQGLMALRACALQENLDSRPKTKANRLTWAIIAHLGASDGQLCSPTA